MTLTPKQCQDIAICNQIGLVGELKKLSAVVLPQPIKDPVTKVSFTANLSAYHFPLRSF
jgi:hypothetical protein